MPRCRLPDPEARLRPARPLGGRRRQAAASATASSCPGTQLAADRGPSTASAAWRRWRASGLGDAQVPRRERATARASVRAPLPRLGGAALGRRHARCTIDRVPAWAGVTCFALVCWRLAADARPRVAAAARCRARLLARSVVTGVVLARFHTLNGLAAGTTLLMLMAALKLLEAQRARDQLVLIGAGLFLLLAACLDRQALLRAPLYAAAGLAVRARRSPRWPAPRLAARRSRAHRRCRALLVAAAARARCCSCSSRACRARSGRSRAASAAHHRPVRLDEPGSITQLVANYDAGLPREVRGRSRRRPAQRYWRGPVLHDFDGRTWRRDRGRAPRAATLRVPGRAGYRYQRRAASPRRSASGSRSTLRAQSPDRARRSSPTTSSSSRSDAGAPIAVSYEAVSYPQTRALGRARARAAPQDTALPAGANPRARELALALRASARATMRAFVRRRARTTCAAAASCTRSSHNCSGGHRR